MLIQKHKKNFKKNKKSFKKFLKKFDDKYVPEIAEFAAVAEKKAWKKIDCLDCGNCCRKMTPTFQAADITRIAKHLGMTEAAFKKKWIKREEAEEDGTPGDLVNISQPCQFLNLEDNKCSIYEVRPADCAEFPHFAKKDFEDQNETYMQNLKFCPVTYEFVKKVKQQVEDEYEW